MKGAICGTLTALGTVMCVLATELPIIPHDAAWRAVGIALASAGVLTMLIDSLKEMRECED